MSREKPVDKNTAKKTIKIFWQATLEQKKYNLPLLLTIPAAQFLQNFATTWIMSGVINTLSTETIAPDQVFAKFGWQLALYALSIAFGELVFWRLSLWLNWKADENAAQKLRERAFDALAVQSMSFHNNKFGGSLVSQMSRFSNAYISLVDTVIWNILPMIISFGLTFAILGRTTDYLPGLHAAVFQRAVNSNTPGKLRFNFAVTADPVIIHRLRTTRYPQVEVAKIGVKKHVCYIKIRHLYPSQYG